MKIRENKSIYMKVNSEHLYIRFFTDLLNICVMSFLRMGKAASDLNQFSPFCMLSVLIST